MPDYTRDEARDWAKANMHGICGCLLPTFNSSLTKINEAAIRHDVRLSREYGYWGTLLIPEPAVTTDQFRDMIDYAVDEAKQVGLRTMLSAAFSTLEESVEMTKYAESAGIDLVMPGYPAMFYPETEDEIFEYTAAIGNASSLGIVLFVIHHWNFYRQHPSGTLGPDLIGRLIDEIPTVVGIKNEIGMPGVGGMVEVFERFGDKVVVTEPFEQNAPNWVPKYDMQFMGTDCYEFAGPKVAEMFTLLRGGQFEDAMKIWWQIHPARQVRMAQAGEYMAGGNLINRVIWKYEAWLNGFNGGPVRQPTLRISDAQMRAIRVGHEKSKLTIAPGTDADFFVGRNPMD